MILRERETARVMGLRPGLCVKKRGLICGVVRRRANAALLVAGLLLAVRCSVPVPDTMFDLLDEYMAEHPPITVTLPWEKPDGAARTVTLVFTGARDAPWRREGFNKYWRAALEACEITPDGKTTGFHQLRHHYASLLISAGEDVRVVAARLGHRPSETLETYAHLFNDEADRTADIVARAHFAESPTDQGRTRRHLRVV